MLFRGSVPLRPRGVSSGETRNGGWCQPRLDIGAMTSQAAITAAVDRLDSAAISRTACEPVRDLLGHDNIPAAYLVQTQLLERRTRRGAVRVGRKIGLTATTVQAQLGVDQPDFGVLLDDMAVADNGVVPSGRLVQPKVEGEIAFLLSDDIEGKITYESARAAVAGMYAAIEIVDSRIRDWDITIIDTVADNASSGLFVLGDHLVGLDVLEPAEAQMSLAVNGVVVSTGTGTACMGDPLTSLVWLARTANRLGAPLRKGEVVLSGALGPMVPVESGDRVDVAIETLGTTRVSFA